MKIKLILTFEKGKRTDLNGGDEYTPKIAVISQNTNNEFLKFCKKIALAYNKTPPRVTFICCFRRLVIDF